MAQLYVPLQHSVLWCRAQMGNPNRTGRSVAMRYCSVLSSTTAEFLPRRHEAAKNGGSRACSFGGRGPGYRSCPADNFGWTAELRQGTPKRCRSSNRRFGPPCKLSVSHTTLDSLSASTSVLLRPKSLDCTLPH